MRSILVVLALVLAGCSDDPTTDDPDDEIFEEVQTTSGKGLIRGIVVDATIQPVPEATIELIGQGTSTVSDSNGAFVFADLEPGSYFVKASKPGWNTVQQSVDVVADVAKPPVARILMEFIPGSEPRVFTQMLEGIIVCSIGQPTNDHSCDATGEQVTQLAFDIDGSPDVIQTEIEWKSTQAAGDNLYVIQGVCVCEGRPSFDERFDESGSATSVHVAQASSEFLSAQEFGVDRKQVWVDVSASGPALGTGAALDQKYRVFVTAFYNVEPIEGWTFVHDGEHPS